jgi:hypothetical protein
MSRLDFRVWVSQLPIRCEVTMANPTKGSL